MEQGITDRLLAHPRTIRDRLQLDHEIADLLEKIQLRSHSLKELYADHDSTRSAEIASLNAAGGLDNFYTQLSSSRTFHKRYPDNAVENLEVAYEIDLPDPNLPVDTEDRIARLFSGEESYGRYFDLNSLHTEFINLKRNRTINYARYLDIFDSFGPDAFPAYVKQDPTYQGYLTNLLNYLESFHRRTAPLEDHAAVLKTLDEGFEKDYVPGTTTNGPDSVMTDATESAGIWCDICQKMYSKQTVFDGHLNSKKHKAGLKALEAGVREAATMTTTTAPTNTGAAMNDKKEIARKEWLISKLGLKFSGIKAATKSNIARKQTLTDKEWQAEQAATTHLTLLPTIKSKSSKSKNGDNVDGDGDDDDGNGDDSDAESEKIYNPLKLPLGWDGKPIPFWLWRLHGLGVEYPCEICGNHIYMGRKAFDRHFLEWRHVHGLRCLGIAPGGGGLFDQITVIRDAVALWDRTTAEARTRDKRRDEGVEMEDESGNVMSEKVYKDLVAQGIL